MIPLLSKMILKNIILDLFSDFIFLVGPDLTILFKL